MTNLPTLGDIAGDPGILKGLELDALAALLDRAEEENKTVSAAKRAVVAEVDDRYAPSIASAYSRAQKDTGTVHIVADGYVITADRAKRVEWDQAQLASVSAAIRAGGDDPGEYIEAKLTVQERKFDAWPEHIRRQFEPARTLKPGPLSLKLAPAKREAA